MDRRKVHETTTPDAVIMDDPYDEHHYDPKSQGLVDTITGTTSVEQSREGEVLQMEYEQRYMSEAVKQLALVLNLSGKHVARVIQASSQVRMFTIPITDTFTPVQLCSKNVERSRLLLSPLPTGTSDVGFIVISADPNISQANFNPANGLFPFNGFVARLAGRDVDYATPLIELHTIENLWVASTTLCRVGVVEEWVS